MDSTPLSCNIKYKDMPIEDIIKDLQHMHHQRYNESVSMGAESFKTGLLFLICGIIIIIGDLIFNSTLSWVSFISIPFFICTVWKGLIFIGFLGSVALGDKYCSQDIVREAIRIKYGICTQEMLNEHMHSSEFILDFIMSNNDQQSTKDISDNQS